MSMETVASGEAVARNNLLELLQTSGIDISGWGQGEAKTLDHLLDELEKGEATLAQNETGELVRLIRIVGVDVFYQMVGGQRLKLVETKQVFNDGRERQRNLDSSVGEKAKPSEDLQAAALRSLAEEIGIVPISLEQTSSDVLARGSNSYPGLQTIYERHLFRAMIAEADFRPDGYTEVQSDKKTYFEWVEA